VTSLTGQNVHISISQTRYETSAQICLHSCHLRWLHTHKSCMRTTNAR